MRKIFENTWLVLQPAERKYFGWLMLFDIIISVLDIVSLAILLWIMQFYVTPSARVPSYLPAWLSDRNSLSIIAFFLLVFSLKNGVAYLVVKAQFQFASKVATRISQNNLVHYQQGDFKEFIEVDSSVHVRRIGFQPFEFCQYILSGIQQVMTQSFLILLAIIAILAFNAQLFILLLILLLPPVVGVFLFIRKKLSSTRSGIRINNERSFQYLMEALKGYVEGNTYQRNSFFIDRFMKFRRMFSRQLFRSMSLQKLPSRIIEIFAILGLFVLIALSQWMGDNTNTIVTLGAFLAAAYKIIPGFVTIINISGQMRAYEFSIGDFVQSTDPVNKETGTPTNIHSVQLKDVFFQYGDQKILNQFVLAAGRGDFIGITGKSGRGKTTIFNLLLGFIKPSSGAIILNGKERDQKALKNFQTSLSYVRQQPFLIYDTILKNITLQEEGYDKDRIQFAIEQAGLEPFISSDPDGLHKMVTENGKNISGGQQQRIMLARAFYKNSDLLLLDEPFNELDEASIEQLLHNLQAYTKMGKIVIMITHDRKSLSCCTKVISLDDE